MAERTRTGARRSRRRKALDPVALEILWTRLITVANEQAAALMRTSFTPIVRESGDLSAALFDPQGRMLAQAVTGTPGHINSLATGMKHFIRHFPPGTLKPGDVLITNDPWLTSGQLNDLSIVTPAFDDDRLLGFFGNTCHAVDIGGFGLSADATDVHQEGLWIPMTKLESEGEPNEELLGLLAANRVGADSLVRYLRDFDLDDLDQLGDEILTRSEQGMREAIAELPDGRYEKTIHTDGLDEPVTIACAVDIEGDAIHIDFAGSSPQANRGINVVLNYTHAYASYALKCAVSPEIPHNDGSFQPVSVSAPEGSILNPRKPAAVAARHIIGHFLPHAVLGALADVVPDRVIAEGAGNIWLTTVRGAGQDRFVSVFFASGGMGARPDKDGLSATSFPSGIATTPVEVVESTSPLVIRRKELRRDSGGAGRYRGGLGQSIEVEVNTGEPYVVSVLSDRFRYAAEGYDGGKPGAKARFKTSEGGKRDPKLSQALPAGSSFTIELPGAGGFHDPKERDPEAVAEDVAEGLVSPRAAREKYGRKPPKGGAKSRRRKR